MSLIVPSQTIRVIISNGVNITIGSGGPGNGNVTGPGSSVANNFASYLDTTGQVIKDSGYSAASFLIKGNNSLTTDLKFDGTNVNYAFGSILPVQSFVVSGNLGSTFSLTGDIGLTVAAGHFINLSGPTIVLSGTTLRFLPNVAPVIGQVPTATDTIGSWTWQNPSGTGGVTSVTGTTNRITSSGGATPQIDISAAYVGQASITTLGTIASGFWAGTIIDVAHGGTGTATPGLVAGTNVAITGSWPNQTINASGGGGGTPGGASTNIQFNNASAFGGNANFIINLSTFFVTFGQIPIFTSGIGSATATTQSAGDNSTKVSTTAYVDSLTLPNFDTTHDGYTLQSGSATKLLLGDGTWTNALPSVTTATTASAGNNSTLVATTAFVAATALPAATASIDGYLLAADWTTFNNKLSNLITTPGDLIVGAITTGAAVRLPIGTALQQLRVNAGATALEWAAAGGSGWATTGVTTLTGVATITSNAAVQHIFNGTWTASANNQNHVEWTGTITSRNTASDTMRYMVIDPTLAVNAGAPATQTLTALLLNPTFTGTATKYVFRGQNAGTDIYTIDNFGNSVQTQGVQTATNTMVSWVQAAHTTSAPIGLSFTGGAHTLVTISTEVTDVSINLTRTVQLIAGGASQPTTTTMRAMLITPPTYSGSSASFSPIINDAATVAISGTPGTGANISIVRKYALWAVGAVRFDGVISSRGVAFTAGAEDGQNTILQSNSIARLTISNSGAFTYNSTQTGGTFQNFVQAAATSGPTKGLFWQSAAHTGQTAATEAIDWDLSFGTIMTFAVGNKALQRTLRIAPRTYSYAGTTSVTDDAVTLAIDGAPIVAGASGTTHTNSHALRIASATTVSGTGATTNSYGLTVLAQTGATNNFVMQLNTSAGANLFSVKDNGSWALDRTITAGGTTGAQTINKIAGTVNLAAAATSLVVTNSLVTTSSIVHCVVRTNDTTAILKNVVCASGSFTILLNAAATAETSVGFIVLN